LKQKSIETMKKEGLEAHREQLKKYGISPDSVEIIQEVIYCDGQPVVTTFTPPPLPFSFTRQ